MKALSKRDIGTRDAIIERCREAFAELDAAIEHYNEMVSAAYNDLEAAAQKYNEARDEAQGWCGDIACEIETYREERSEKWQDSEAGQAYTDWQEQYEGCRLERAEFEAPEPLAIEFEDAGDTLENLPESP